MVWRIHFSEDDLARIQVSPTLASRAGISLAAASQHASVLRGAGLIVTRRQGGAVLHVLTPLGAELLQAG